MKEVFITSVQLSSSDATGISMSLAPRFVSIEYTPIDARGRPGTPVVFSWNVRTNVIK
jgi:SH3-like domain-containing protein